MLEKKFKINGNELLFSDINLKKNPIYSELATFLSQFYNSDPFFELSSSGSTGTPKTIRIKKEFMKVSAQKTLNFLEIEKGAKVLLCLPMDKIGGIMILVRWLVADLDLYLTNPKANPLLEFDEDFELCSMVPYQAEKSLANLGQVKKLIIGGAAVSPHLEEKLSKINIESYHSFGMSETISHIALRRIGSDLNFKCLEGIEISVDQNSCLIINSEDIGLRGLKTNDVVEIKQGNEFRWKGRIDNVINSAGLKFYPEEIESKIGDLPVEYFIAGKEDSELGEKIILVLESDSKLDYDFPQLSKYEKPKEIYHLPVFIRTKTGKIKREEILKALFEINP